MKLYFSSNSFCCCFSALEKNVSISFAIGMCLPVEFCVLRLPSVKFADLVELGVATVSGTLIKLHGVVSLVPLQEAQFIFFLKKFT